MVWIKKALAFEMRMYCEKMTTETTKISTTVIVTVFMFVLFSNNVIFILLQKSVYQIGEQPNQ